MTVNTTNSRISYTGDGTSVAFPFPYEFLASTDIEVYLNFVVQGAGFTVSGAGNPQGGTVTFTAAPAAGVTILLARVPDLLQSTALPPNDPFPSDAVEKGLDKLTMIAQQLSADQGRSVHFPLSETVDGELPLSGQRANKVYAFDLNGNPTLVPMPSSLGAGDLGWEKGIDGTRGFKAGVDFTPDVTAQLTLSRSPINEANVWAYWDGVEQTDFSITSGNNLNFPTAIPSGISVVNVRVGTTLSLNQPAQGSVTDDSVATGAGINTSKLSYTAPYAGSVARTQQSKNSDIVSIADFGGSPSASADANTAAALAAHATGLPVYYPAGTWNLNPFSFAAGGIVGAGQGATILNFTDTSAADLITYTGTGSSGSAIPVFGSFSIYGALAKSSGSALRFNASSGQLAYPYINNVGIQNVAGGIRFTNTGQFAICGGCNIINYAASKGIWIENTNDPDFGDSSISDCFLNTSVPTGSTYGIWYRSSGGLKVVNTKILGGDSCFVMGFNSASKNVADLLIANCSFENALQYGIFLGRDSGAFNFGTIKIADTEIGCAQGIATDSSGFMTLLNIDGHTINLTSTTGTAIVLNNVANFSIGEGIINAQAGSGTTVGISITSSCSNGKIAPQTFVGIPAASCIVNGSSSVYVRGAVQKGTASITASTAYGSLFQGSVAVTFPVPYLVAPDVRCFPSGTGGGQISCFPINITTTGFTMVGISATSSGSMTNNEWTAEGII